MVWREANPKFALKNWLGELLMIFCGDIIVMNKQRRERKGKERKGKERKEKRKRKDKKKEKG